MFNQVTGQRNIQFRCGKYVFTTRYFKGNGQPEMIFVYCDDCVIGEYIRIDIDKNDNRTLHAILFGQDIWSYSPIRNYEDIEQYIEKGIQKIHDWEEANISLEVTDE